MWQDEDMSNVQETDKDLIRSGPSHSSASPPFLKAQILLSSGYRNATSHLRVLQPASGIPSDTGHFSKSSSLKILNFLSHYIWRQCVWTPPVLKVMGLAMKLAMKQGYETTRLSGEPSQRLSLAVGEEKLWRQRSSLGMSHEKEEK